MCFTTLLKHSEMYKVYVNICMSLLTILLVRYLLKTKIDVVRYLR